MCSNDDHMLTLTCFTTLHPNAFVWENAKYYSFIETVFELKVGTGLSE